MKNVMLNLAMKTSKASFRRRLAMKTHLVTQDLAQERNQTPFHDPEGRREILLFSRTG
jgi:hypothetical protein